ncbi:hypothetical protein BKA58DRAFT_421521 [Alternaria rosae]|uniref:uncharacterized protein n=1 Tax=Alternaria rosae TaxID=1187941 RepID=UPI001E8CF2EB|nr:uncharacterized protein BKA58DRAFT_421521 [Alternaria rosae]KAH6868185.1 hypothetical protein BKA58DRAFT_421521 [Alternaria rosae]
MYLLTLLTLLSGLIFTSAMPFTPYKHFGTSPHLDPSQAPEYCSALPQTPSVKWCLWPNFAKQCYTRAYEPQPWCENFYQYESRPRSIGPDMGGNCRFYKEFDCGENRDAVEIWEGSKERPLECPGLSFTGDPKWFKSMKCMRD